MASRSPAMYKRIVRKIGSDSLPLEVLSSLKNPTPEINLTKNVSDKHRKTWQPNLKLKRLFSYIHDQDIAPKVSIYSIRCIDRMGRITKHHFETPFDKTGKEKGCLWKGKVERMYVNVKSSVGYLSPEEEDKIAKTSKSSRHQRG